MNRLIINKYEVAIFPKDFYVSDLNSLMQEFKKIDVFANGVNTIIPLPPNAPREIPRLLLSSKDKLIGCNVTFDKINVYWLNSNEKANFSKPVAEITSLINTISQTIFSHTGTRRAKRIGFIKEYYIETDEPVGIVKGKTVSDTIASDLKDFILQLTFKLENLSSYSNCNEVVILNSGGMKQTEKKKVLMLTHDINTIQTEEVNWDSQQISQFITEAYSKSDKKSLKERFFV